MCGWLTGPAAQMLDRVAMLYYNVRPAGSDGMLQDLLSALSEEPAPQHA
jgi:hypothetical protein